MIEYSPLRRIVLALLALVCALSAGATHNRAGEIRVRQVGPLTLEVTVVTYTAFQGNSRDADRDAVVVNWGDMTADSVLRANGRLDGRFRKGEPIGTNIQVNFYTARHTYGGRGCYVIGMGDPNRVDNIRNINNGGSVDVEFYIRTQYCFLNADFQGPNSTPELLQAPIDEGCVGQTFTHNPNAFDPDGDSLAYRLGVPLRGEGVPVTNYQLPGEFGGNPGTNNFSLDQRTGTITWATPQQAGNYNVVIRVISYRAGQAIDTTVRDMQITIRTCENRPPVVEVANEFCLVTGETLTLNPTATAPVFDDGQQVRLTATSPTLTPGFFAPATWNGDSLYHPQPWTREYRWQTACEHAARFPYQVIFKATDDAATLGQPNNLSRLEVVTIKVSAPPPQDLRVSADNGLVDLSWEAPYVCEDARERFFFGFSVWRREGSNPFPYDSCRQGLDGRGYSRIAIAQKTQSNGRYVFVDDNTERGRTYCYRVLAQFVRYTATNKPFNSVESLPSAEVCIQSSRDLPLLTKVDVLSTDAAAGSIDVRWTPPLPSDLDTTVNRAPYTYTVLRSPGVGTSNFVAVPGTERTYPSYAALTRDTQYVDTGLNTLSQGYTYAIRFASAGQTTPLPPLSSSSVFLTAAPANQATRLSWTSSTSWENVSYAVLRQNAAGQFDTLARVTATSYLDRDLVNGREYCYRIVAVGTYGVSTIYSPLINNSQRSCSVPSDVDGPCPPTFTVQTICDELSASNTNPPYPTTITYGFGGSCTPAPDLAAVRVYSASDSTGGGRVLLAELPYPAEQSFTIRDEQQIARCYVLSAVDSIGNEGEFTAPFCVTNCPLYQLPNVFTPNGDNQHDVLRPRINRFVERVEIAVFNRWGVKVYESEDPLLGWDGTTLGGEPVNDGTYLYKCRVFERQADGSVVEVGNAPLSGAIEVLRGG